MTPNVLLRALRQQGFDKSTTRDGYATVRCSQCQALVINGVATHEAGCPNQRRNDRRLV